MPTLDERVQRLEAEMSSLLEDTKIGGVLTGPLPVSETHMGIRIADGTRYYEAGAITGNVSDPTIAPMLANQLYAIPLLSSHMSIDRIAFRVTTPASGDARVGIYDSGANLYPCRLLYDLGEVAVNSTGWKAFPATPAKKSLSRGLKWIVVVSDVALWVGTVQPSNRWAILGRDSLDIVANRTMWVAAFDYAALPDLFPVGATAYSETPMMLYRVVAS